MKFKKSLIAALAAFSLLAGVAVAGDDNKPTQAQQKATAAVQSGVQGAESGQGKARYPDPGSG